MLQWGLYLHGVTKANFPIFRLTANTVIHYAFKTKTNKQTTPQCNSVFFSFIWSCQWRHCNFSAPFLSSSSSSTRAPAPLTARLPCGFHTWVTPSADKPHGSQHGSKQRPDFAERSAARLFYVRRSHTWANAMGWSWHCPGWTACYGLRK